MEYKGHDIHRTTPTRRHRLKALCRLPHTEERKKRTTGDVGREILVLASTVNGPTRRTRLTQFQSIEDEEAIPALIKFIERDMDTKMEYFILSEFSRRIILQEDLRLLAQRLNAAESERERLLAVRLIVGNMRRNDDELLDVFVDILTNNTSTELKRISIGALRQIDSEKSIERLGQFMDETDNEELKYITISALSESRLLVAFNQLIRQINDIGAFIQKSEYMKVNLVMALERFAGRHPEVTDNACEVLKELLQTTGIEEIDSEASPWKGEVNRILPKAGEK
ncbi:HEAT repeat domain-containing protein [Candidatus Micrarchaeota archaeon]|nr:HEAT repeat domain-containing protein [Candidatus Micrarchaeota archaeon]MBU1165882.1 HEAT repeat domain-containing protein [Candidatus Micrarchaeota archaeon]MBU1886996.1 HEAT repeat domain-containing protein [Candidatus Micrarchaeota archaeon]